MKKYDNFGVMIDCSRNSVKTVESLKQYMQIIAKMGYNMAQLYTEDTFEVEDEPYFGYMRGRYTINEIQELDAFAKTLGIELVPAVQTLAHLSQLLRWDCYWECVDCADILLVDNDRTYKLIDNMFKTLSKAYSSRKINIGMDEAHLIGSGKYFDQHGYVPRIEIMKKHLDRVLEIAGKYGFECMMWSDMFFRLANKKGDYYDINSHIPQNIVDIAPKNVDLIYWDYYHYEDKEYDHYMQEHLKFDNKLWFAGGAWTFNGYVPQFNLSFKTLMPGMRACDKFGIKNVLVTMWGDSGGECSIFSMLPAILLAIEYAHGNYDMNKIKEKFEQIVGDKWDNFIDFELPNMIGKEEVLNQNPSKYLLYNDFLLGISDSTIVKEENRYAEYAEILRAHAALENRWSYLYKTEAALCDVLALKFDIGVLLRESYLKNDKKTLQKLIDYNVPRIISDIEIFYEHLRKQWFLENKANGFEIQDLRLGGVIMRGKHCIKRVQDFIDGKISKIEELDEPRLDPYCREEKDSKKTISFSEFKVNATVGRL